MNTDVIGWTANSMTARDCAVYLAPTRGKNRSRKFLGFHACPLVSRRTSSRARCRSNRWNAVAIPIFPIYPQSCSIPRVRIYRAYNRNNYRWSIPRCYLYSYRCSPASDSIYKAILYYLFETFHDCWSNDTRFFSTMVVYRVAMDTRVLYPCLRASSFSPS